MKFFGAETEGVWGGNPEGVGSPPRVKLLFGRVSELLFLRFVITTRVPRDARPRPFAPFERKRPETSGFDD